MRLRFVLENDDGYAVDNIYTIAIDFSPKRPLYDVLYECQRAYDEITQRLKEAKEKSK